MEFVVSLLLLLIMFIVIGMLWNNSMWGNALMLVNVTLAGLIAMHYFEALAEKLEGWNASWKYYWDFLSIWVIFIAAMLVLRLATDFVSRTQVKFKKPVEMVGGIVFAVAVGWVFLGFTMTTLHMAPLSRNFLFGAWQPEPKSKMVFGLAPDRQWLGFCYAVTHGGSLASGYAAQDPEAYGFDSRGDFVLRYGYRRDAFALPLEKASHK